MSEIAFVLGNGTSRKQISIQQLKEISTVYACNAVYRETSVPYLVAVDTKMVKEITDSNYHLENQVWTNPNKYTKTLSNINLFNPSKGWSSGPTALWLASQHNYKKIFFLGFDYTGLGNQHELVNNIYSGTHNYKKQNERSTYYGNWVRQTTMTINSHPKIKYIRVVENKKSFIPDHLKDLPNLFHITVPEFVEKFRLKPLPA